MIWYLIDSIIYNLKHMKEKHLVFVIVFIVIVFGIFAIMMYRLEQRQVKLLEASNCYQFNDNMLDVRECLDND